jgi:hypothetical protein
MLRAACWTLHDLGLQLDENHERLADGAAWSFDCRSMLSSLWQYKCARY